MRFFQSQYYSRSHIVYISYSLVTNIATPANGYARLTRVPIPSIDEQPVIKNIIKSSMAIILIAKLFLFVIFRLFILYLYVLRQPKENVQCR